MKRLRFSGLLLYAAMALFFASCGGQKTQTNSADSTTSSATDTTASTMAPPANTIVTTPENMVVVTHKVADFTKWKAAYDDHDSGRLAYGLHNYVIARGLKDSNMVMVALKADDTAKEKAFIKDPGLKKAMQKGGVTGTPTISLFTAVFQDTATLNDALRARSTFTVKDWDTWQKAFEDGKQERMDNGITDRVYGHEMNDNKKVTVVVVLTDTAKAFAYYKSDALKERMKAAGIIGEPQRFVYRIVEKY